ncbi:MAG TPA: MBL fold metallo-hydrolase, partial [Bacteroidia bacterium]|nr:MBL fold metallo-hydrolase [Bacteroidia bacterium]
MRIVLIFFLLIPSYAFCQSFESKHFTIQKLSEGVFAAIARNGGYAICNAGIIGLGDATLIFDPFMTPEAAQDLRTISEQLTGHKVKYVVNSHFHNDHIGGNQVFNDATIISTEKTRELIAKFQPEEAASDKKDAPEALEMFRKKDTSLMTPHEKEENTMWKGYYEALVRSSDSLKTILPNVTFLDRLTITGTSFPIQLISYGTAHTLSDLFLYLPSQRIAFPGDILFIKNQPWLGDGDPVKWQSYLKAIAKLNPQVLVPGHGPVGSLQDIDQMESNFKSVKDTAFAYYKRKLNPENEKTIASPAPYNNWFLSNFFKPNVISEFHRFYKNPVKK